MAVKADTICGVFDKHRREQLRIHHESALHEGKETFTFEGHQYVTGFTKYLLEYLDMELD